MGIRARGCNRSVGNHATIAALVTDQRKRGESLLGQPSGGWFLLLEQPVHGSERRRFG
jgi:hypothetical protein